jgi:hypothetical protein
MRQTSTRILHCAIQRALTLDPITYCVVVHFALAFMTHVPLIEVRVENASLLVFA